MEVFTVKVSFSLDSEEKVKYGSNVEELLSTFFTGYYFKETSKQEPYFEPKRAGMNSIAAFFEMEVHNCCKEEDAFNFMFTIFVNPLRVRKTHHITIGLQSNFMDYLDPTSNFFRGRSWKLECGNTTRSFTVDEYTLFWANRHNRLAIVTGTGLSISLTKNKLSTWTNFLNELRVRVWPLEDPGTFDFALFEKLKDDSHAQSEYVYVCAERDKRTHIITSAILGIISQLIPAPEPLETWRTALNSFRGPILTFNYDVSLEVAIGRIPIDGSSSRTLDILGRNLLNEMEKYVIHLHGIFTDEQSIVLSQKTYLEAAKTVPNIFKTLAEQGYVFLYIGVNGVLTDPDLSPYWRWEDVCHSIKNDRASPGTHFVLFAEKKTPPFPVRTDNKTPFPFFRKISYADNDLIPDITSFVVNGTFNSQQLAALNNSKTATI